MTDTTYFRRLVRRTALAEAVLKAFHGGQSGDDLYRIVQGCPFDLDETEDGFTFRLFGVESTRCRSRTGALVDWAHLTDAATDDPGAPRRERIVTARRAVLIRNAIHSLNSPSAVPTTVDNLGPGHRPDPAPGPFHSGAA